MKNFLIALVMLFTFHAWSYSENRIAPWPRLTVWADNVEVWIQNFDNRQYRCSGTVWLYFESGRTRSEFISLYLGSRATARRVIYSYDSDDRIRTAHHTINCF